MSSWSECYRKYGERAALLALVPGLAHFRNRQFLVGIATAAAISIMLLWVCWLSLLQFGSQHSNLATTRACFLFWTLAVWQASVFHAYLSAKRLRQEIGARHSVDLAVQLATSDESRLRATAHTKNLSRSGACLVVSKALPLNAQLALDFGTQVVNAARVIWSRPTGNGTETLVGVEFARPLPALVC